MPSLYLGGGKHTWLLSAALSIIYKKQNIAPLLLAAAATAAAIVAILLFLLLMLLLQHSCRFELSQKNINQKIPPWCLG